MSLLLHDAGKTYVVLRFDEAVSAAKSSDAAVVMVGTWSRDQTLRE